MRPISRHRWNQIQEVERGYHIAKDPRSVLDLNLVYWRRVLDALPPGFVTVGPETRALDVGCGGSGILLALDQGNRTGIDPLMDFYRKRFPFLDQTDIRWLEGTAEEIDEIDAYDLIFSINMLDHTRDPADAARRMVRALAPGGLLVCLLNVHRSRFWRWYFRTLYRVIDPPHPHHILSKEVPALFQGLELIEIIEIDPLWLDLKAYYESRVLGRSPRCGARSRRSLFNPFKYPLAVARLLGTPVHSEALDQNPLIRPLLYVFKAVE